MPEKTRDPRLVSAVSWMNLTSGWRRGSKAETPEPGSSKRLTSSRSRRFRRGDRQVRAAVSPWTHVVGAEERICRGCSHPNHVVDSPLNSRRNQETSASNPARKPWSARNGTPCSIAEAFCGLNHGPRRIAAAPPPVSSKLMAPGWRSTGSAETGWIQHGGQGAGRARPGVAPGTPG